MDGAERVAALARRAPPRRARDDAHRVALPSPAKRGRGAPAARGEVRPRARRDAKAHPGSRIPRRRRRHRPPREPRRRRAFPRRPGRPDPRLPARDGSRGAHGQSRGARVRGGPLAALPRPRRPQRGSAAHRVTPRLRGRERGGLPARRLRSPSVARRVGPREEVRPEAHRRRGRQVSWFGGAGSTLARVGPLLRRKAPPHAPLRRGRRVHDGRLALARAARARPGASATAPTSPSR